MPKPKKPSKPAKQAKASELVKKVEKAMPGWKVKASQEAATPDSAAPSAVASDARLPSMKELRRKYLGPSAVSRDAAEPALTDETESLEIESGDVSSRVWIDKTTGAPRMKRG
jgi:hypothetical protein